MASFYKDFLDKIATPLSGFGIASTDIPNQIMKNLLEPLGSGPMGAQKVSALFGSPDEYFKKYENFEQLYRIALQKEEQSTIITPSQRSSLRGARDAPNIDLTLIKNRREQQRLLQIYYTEILPVESIIRQAGAPGLPLHSSNQYRIASSYLVDMEQGKHHPLLAVVGRTTFNIDPTQSGPAAFGAGISSIPSTASLRSMVENSSKMSSGDLLRPTVGGQIKVFTFDVETSGLGTFDKIRSFAASSMTITNDSKKGVQYKMFGNIIDQHFVTPEMQEYTLGRPGAQPRGLGQAAYEIEQIPNKSAPVVDLTKPRWR
jgi:hypothetical protein